MAAWSARFRAIRASSAVTASGCGLMVTPYVNQAGRLAFSLKAAGVRPVGRQSRATAGDSAA